jgi:Flp pilus assembly protein TadG
MRRHGASEGGYVEVVVPVLLLLTLICGGMVYDGGTMLMAKRDVINLAESAARAGAMEVDEVHLRRTGNVRVDVDAAHAAATDYLNRAGRPGTVTVSNTVVHVSTSTPWHPDILGTFGVPGRTIDGSAYADVLTGIVAPD